MRFDFVARLWEWQAQDGWYFVTVPEEASADIRELPRLPRGFGAVRVRVTVGTSTWMTSIFPDSSRGAYVLPVKKSVRVAERLTEGDELRVLLEVMMG